MTLHALLIVAGLSVFLPLSAGHGRLWEPPSRSSMWRRGWGNPTNYNDNQLNCGGFSRQWEGNNGMCGICGDPYDGERENEAGGRYANGIITKTYTEGQEIEVVVQITAQHKGWFEYRICPNNDVSTPATQECLDKYLLPLADGSGTRYDIKQLQKQDYHVMLKLPMGLTCEQCVFQWKWHGGNNWGSDPDGGCVGIGCGAQEQFYGCSDVRIVPADGQGDGHGSDGGSNERTAGMPEVTEKPVERPEGSTQGRPSGGNPTRQSTEPPRTRAPTTTPRPTRGRPDGGNPQERIVCRAAGKYKGRADMDEWCVTNCAAGFCPASHCRCETLSSDGEEDEDERGATNGTHVRPQSTERPVQRPEGGPEGRPSPSFPPRESTERPPTAAPTMATRPTRGRPDGGNPQERIVCRAAGKYVAHQGMDEWCVTNCAAGFCPPSHCRCETVQQNRPSTTTSSPGSTTTRLTPERLINGDRCTLFEAHGSYAGDAAMDAFCQTACAFDRCPERVCVCASPAPSVRMACHPEEEYANVPGFDMYCASACHLGRCPGCSCIMP